MQNILKRLSTEFVAKQVDDCIELTIPLITHTNGGLLELKIKPTNDGYTLCYTDNMFVEANAGGDQEYYFNIFKKHDKNCHFDIKIKNGLICKDYSADFNVAVAINEFIRFFVTFDDFIINNNVIGNETDFE